MSKEPLRYFLDLGDRTFLVRKVKGREGLSSPFRIELAFRIEDGGQLDPREVVKTRATLRLVQDDDVRVLDGIITRVSTSAALRGAPETRIVFEPRLSLARYRQDMRVFRNKTVPEIVVFVLEHLGIETELRLASSYERRPYCVQFRETDFAFVSRLLEDEGIFYYFLPGDIMVLADHSAAYEPLPEQIPFRAGLGMDRGEAAVIAVGRRARLGPSKVTLRDFNPEKPNLDMDTRANIPSPSGTEWYDYPGEYGDPAAGQRKATLRAEAFACAAGEFTGKSLVGAFFPGAVFSLLGAPEGMAEGRYVVTALEHHFRMDASGFSNDFRALPADITFRPPCMTPAPEIVNPQTGFVTCPPGDDDIYTDAWGRVKVHFHWDRKSPRDGECSHWIPVLQDNTGQSSAIPRQHWEVVVHYLEGDPDRPVVLGRVYNGGDVFPYHPPRDKTKSSLKSLSTPSRDGTNEIRLEDRAGIEHIWVHAQRDMNVVVANDKKETIMANEARTVERDESVAIGVDHSLEVGGKGNVEIGGDQTWTVAAKRSREVRGEASSSITADRSVVIGGMHFRRIGTTDQVNTENLTEVVGAVDLEVSLKGNSAEGEKGGSVTVGGAIIEIAKAEKSESAGLARAETIGGVFFTKAGEEIGTRASMLRKTMVGGSMKVKATEDMTISAVSELKVKAKEIAFTDETSATLQVGATKVTLADGVMTVEATSEIKFDISATNKQGAKKSVQI